MNIQNRLRKLIETNRPIYVRNKTGHFADRTAILTLQIAGGAHTKTLRLEIPATHYPFQITSVPAERLVESADFYNAVAKGVLDLMDPDEAELELRDPHVRQAVKNATAYQLPQRRAAHNAGPRMPNLDPRAEDDELKKRMEQAKAQRHPNSSPYAGQTLIDPANPNGQMAAAEHGPNLHVAASSGVEGRVERLIMDINTDSSIKDNVISQLETMHADGRVKYVDLGWIVDNCEVKTVKNWAKKKMSSSVDKALSSSEEEVEMVKNWTTKNKALASSEEPESKSKRRRRKKKRSADSEDAE